LIQQLQKKLNFPGKNESPDLAVFFMATSLDLITERGPALTLEEHVRREPRAYILASEPKKLENQAQRELNLAWVARTS
jgi:hypothetical protein